MVTGKKPSRKAVPPANETAVLTKSARRCLLCFHLDGILTEKAGQIAHLDQDPSNGSEDNLAWMCMPHHSQYDSKTSQHKNYTLPEVKVLRSKIYEAIARGEHREKPLEGRGGKGGDAKVGGSGIATGGPGGQAGKYGIDERSSVMAPFYWERHPDGPFATLIAIATTYLDPENYYAIDIRQELLDEGYRSEIEPAGLDDRFPRHNWVATATFDISAFNRLFDFGIAQYLHEHINSDQNSSLGKVYGRF